MIVKIIKGADFGGVINYMLSKQEGKAMVLASNNIGFTDRKLTERYGLTLGEGKKAVNRQQLRGEDKLRYEIFDAIKAVLPQSKNWKGFVAGLDKQGITTRFKTKGNTDVVQGIIFVKDGFCFSGSKIDRSCSFSRLNAEIERNSHKQEQINLQNEPMAHPVDESNFITDLSEAISEVFSMPTPSNGVDVDELRFQKKLRIKVMGVNVID